ncbi:hypothetical protein VNO77_17204 [Canavalia gladiata]|uniref:Homeobox domain-containing protein n=1 Tax=Canavalia gladiata TaxID=3824 RepID=A0AAN9LM68_CANGL
MELALSLGDAPKPFSLPANHSVGFCITIIGDQTRGSSDPPLQLDLLPSTPVLPIQSLGVQRVTSSGVLPRALDVNRLLLPAVDETDGGAALSSPNSAASSFQMDICIGNSNNGRHRSEHEGEVDGEGEGEGEGASDDEENGSARKKLRLSKEQSAFLEHSFKEHTTLNPKQKLSLAKRLNLRPRQVEVWFQNRRARTKLKQTEVDCEYLKRSCESLTEENRRLQKELQELRALKTCQPFYMQLPATTLTMCPSCERVATNTNGASTTNAINA